MNPTPFPHVNTLLTRLLIEMPAILGEKLVGLYLFGSLVIGDYDATMSDVDMLAALSEPLDEREFAALDAMHNGIVRDDSWWENRFEIRYISLHGLKTFRTETSKVGVICPGDPFHIIDAGRDWLINLAMVRDSGQTLYGVPPAAIIDPITRNEFVDTVRLHVHEWRTWMYTLEHRGSQAYAIVTMCRALYSVTHGEQVSKRAAAEWAQRELPEYADLIARAMVWRKVGDEPDVDHAATLPETHRFVHAMIDRMIGEASP